MCFPGYGRSDDRCRCSSAAPPLPSLRSFRQMSTPPSPLRPSRPSLIPPPTRTWTQSLPPYPTYIDLDVYTPRRRPVPGARASPASPMIIDRVPRPLNHASIDLVRRSDPPHPSRHPTPCPPHPFTPIDSTVRPAVSPSAPAVRTWTRLIHSVSTSTALPMNPSSHRYADSNPPKSPFSVVPWWTSTRFSSRAPPSTRMPSWFFVAATNIRARSTPPSLIAGLLLRLGESSATPVLPDRPAPRGPQVPTLARVPPAPSGQDPAALHP